MSQIRISHTAAVQGTSQMTASDLLPFLKAIPGDASITIVFQEAGKPDSAWTAKATWSSEPAAPGVFPKLHYQPGVRSFDGDSPRYPTAPPSGVGL